MTQTEALKLALEALEVANSLVDGYYLPKEKAWLPEIEEAITAIKAVLKANDEPVVWNEGVPAMLPKQKEGETFIVSYEPKLEAKDEPVGTAGELFTNTALERLDFRPSTKIYVAPPQQDDYKALWQQMCERCDELDKKLAQPEHGWTPERIAGMARLKAQQDKRLEPQRTWVGLTDNEFEDLVEDEDWFDDPVNFAKIIQTKLKELNT